MKKTLFIIGAFFTTVTVALASPKNARPDKEVLENFQSAFPEVKTVKWFDLGNYFQAYFLDANRTTRIDYSKKGKIIRSLENYGPADLPVYIRARIKEDYPLKSIKGVTELTTKELHVYEIVLEDERFWYKLRSDHEGNLSLEVKLVKG